MEVVIYLILAWVITAFFLFQKKELVFVENLFLFLFFLFLNKNVVTLLSLNLGMIEYSKEIHLFICFWIQRNVITPVLLLIFVNAIFQKSTRVRLGWGIVFIAIGFSVETLAIVLNILKYQMWSFLWSFILSIVYLCLALGLSKGYRYLLAKEGVVNGY